MDVVGAVPNAGGVRYQDTLGKAADRRSDDRNVESVPTGPTFSPQDSEGAGRSDPPVVQLIRESAASFEVVLGESKGASAGGVKSGALVDVYA